MKHILIYYPEYNHITRYFLNDGIITWILYNMKSKTVTSSPTFGTHGYYKDFDAWINHIKQQHPFIEFEVYRYD